MKKFISILLMLWLPLFMQSAWAMSTHMLLDEAGVDTHASNVIEASGRCHQSDSHKSEIDHSDTTHNCTHCIACALVTASASFDTAPTIALQPISNAVAGDAVFYTSPYLIPLIKPPIQA